MSFIDVILLTLFNTLACLALPKLLSLVLAVKTKKAVHSDHTITLQELNTEVPSFL
ncbi:hypothetical protein Cal7507_2415 [Calothrix sp. PCC 7507]|nr:hypothetical protein Cal7507_2415 [Calothrix sp. PCC 7507]